MGFWIRKLIPMTAALALAVMVAATLMAQENPQQLVRETIQNELTGGQHPNYWMYRDNDTVSGKNKVERVVETPQCWFRWLLSTDGQPPTAEQQQKQQSKINRLVTDESARQKSREASIRTAKKPRT